MSKIKDDVAKTQIHGENMIWLLRAMGKNKQMLIVVVGNPKKGFITPTCMTAKY